MSKAKVITFFNEKGGTGKTFFNTLFASWLAYSKRERVFVIDMDYPNYQLSSLREFDKSVISQYPESPLAKMSLSHGIPFYPVGKAAGKAAFSTKELETIAKTLIVQKQQAGGGYFILDFPGRYLANDPVHYLSRKGLLDLVVFPIDSDRQSRASALQTYAEMQRVSEVQGGQKAVFLWNRETQQERSGRKDWYAESVAVFNDMGLDVVEKRMHDILIARRDAVTFGFIRNTMCWPEQNVAKACGYVSDIFEEIKSRADGTWNNKQK